MEAADKLSLRQLRYFAAVAEYGSFRQAAFKLNITQPTLSNQISVLEELLGLQLFERSRSGTSTTVEGRELLISARRVIEEAQGFSTQAGSLSGGGVGTYRLGVTPTLGPYLLPHILSPIHSRYKDLKLYVREEAPSDLESGLINSQFDFILSTLPIMSKELVVMPLFREPLKLAITKDHKLASKVRINRMDLLGEQVLTISEHHLFHRQISELCEKVGASVRRDYEGTSLDTLRQMVVMGMGMAFLPALYVRSEIRQESELRIADVEGVNVVRNHALVWRNTSPARNFYRQLALEIREIIREKLSDVVIPIEAVS
ncbi:MAG TPA: hydrogen peroxide-inducible genes activator [Gammaproteobacteria bacterium]|nr:hydrogen peroxide-inducible genes activator [Gammaproteobacteria bacterium]|tara:strand:+ start:1294 stop:2241 length:948 start_codon:yes stop_codon:yes gene_type:complete